ncbi:hypothetical protein FA13DRAFT_1725649 [Coprinellus micaceus]|jgi:hypothetical protein|uniref:Uncharacterized protein n=1 Tax=Coprinellus micaceus TaxID=71717 RepID=A0A4Y7TWT1_COPMI|nr:hypothetical protein FA13DRAFT_1725649 [Coprinellus micaceus]
MSVDLNEFASTNRPPSDTELEQLKTILAPGESKLAQLEKDIKANQDENERLWKEKEKLLKELTPARSAASLIRRLPTEIMEAIFLHARAPKDQYACFRVCDAPLILLRVCKLWRNIAMHTQELWSSIDISIPFTVIPLQAPPSPEDLRKQELFLAEVDKWITRSANLPLSLRLRKGEHISGAPSGHLEVLHTVLVKLLTQSHRWELLDFESLSETLRAFQKTTPLPQLKCIRVTDYGWYNPHGLPDGPRSLFDYRTPFDSPALQKLIITSNTDSPESFNKLHVHWENLVALTIAAPYARSPSHGWGDPIQSMAVGLLPTLAKCANLRRLCLSLPMASESANGGPTPITLPSLEALSLEGCCKEMELFLALVETPSIRELHYYPGYDLSSHITSGFTNLLHKYGDQVEVLAFDLPTLPESEFLSCLRNIPIVKQLSVGPDRFESRFGSPPFYSFINPNGRFIFTNSHIAALTPKQGEDCSCPRLEVFRCAVKAAVTPDVVMCFLKAKIDPGLRQISGGGPFRELSLVHLPFEYPIPPYRPQVLDDDDDPLKDVRKAGVLLDLARPNYYNPSGYHGPYIERFTQYESDFRH